MELLIAYMCPYGLEYDFSTSFFPHFWKGNIRYRRSTENPLLRRDQQ